MTGHGEDVEAAVLAAGVVWHAARARADEAGERCAEAVRAAAAAGVSEVACAELARVDRQTVRRMLGKPRYRRGPRT